MIAQPQWFLIESEQGYQEAIGRYEKIKYVSNGSDQHKEKLLLTYLISEYEKWLWDLPEADPIEFIK